jgi:hypothetical protein
MENGEIDSVGGTGSAAGAADEHRPRRAVPRWLPATWQPDPRPQTDIGQPRWRILHSWVSSLCARAQLEQQCWRLATVTEARSHTVHALGASIVSLPAS